MSRANRTVPYDAGEGDGAPAGEFGVRHAPRGVVGARASGPQDRADAYMYSPHAVYARPLEFTVRQRPPSSSRRNLRAAPSTSRPRFSNNRMLLDYITLIDAHTRLTRFRGRA